MSGVWVIEEWRKVGWRKHIWWRHPDFPAYNRSESAIAAIEASYDPELPATTVNTGDVATLWDAQNRRVARAVALDVVRTPEVLP